MTDSFALIPLGVSLLLGMILGGLYFGVLWLSIERLIHSSHPTTYLMIGLLVRLALLMTCLFFILDIGNWVQLIAAILGFIVSRSILVRVLQGSKKPQDSNNDNQEMQS